MKKETEENWKGKTLDECATAQDEKEVLYIGGHEAFFWIGTKKEYEAEIDDVNDYMVNYMKESIQKKKETIEMLKKQIKNMQTYIEKWTPLRTRAVKDCYSGIDPKEPGTKILIKGKTVGPRYWLKKEYERERRPDGTVQN